MTRFYGSLLAMGVGALLVVAVLASGGCSSRPDVPTLIGPRGAMTWEELKEEHRERGYEVRPVLYGAGLGDVFWCGEWEKVPK